MESKMAPALFTRSIVNFSTANHMRVSGHLHLCRTITGKVYPSSDQDARCMNSIKIKETNQVAQGRKIHFQYHHPIPTVQDNLP